MEITGRNYITSIFGRPDLAVSVSPSGFLFYSIRFSGFGLVYQLGLNTYFKYAKQLSKLPYFKISSAQHTILISNFGEILREDNLAALLL